MRYLLVGYGNPLRSDDGVGPVVARRFLDEAEALMGAAAKEVRVVAVPQLVPELAEAFSEAERVVLVDASRGDAPGAVRVRRVEPSTASGEPMIHAYDPSTLATWAAKLYGRAPEMHVVAVGAETFAFGEGLSPDVAAAVPEILSTVAGLFREGRPGGAEAP
ncbi:hydrogenase maturation protease [Shumkonia mesophila]|uniref:hydrogenase maturation protease n=1 Tax=Shumkonia mesophila TaxID=2838854 RepID=UPI002934171B|nr:hydrogenase maturation protease [Shumkonia mesophila]